MTRYPIVIESPFVGDVERNVAYTRRAMLDAIERGEAPFASHLLYPQLLDDTDPEQRRIGIECGFAVADAIQEWHLQSWQRLHALACSDAPPCTAAFYVDLGWSPGMLAARERYDSLDVFYTERTIGPNP